MFGRTNYNEIIDPQVLNEDALSLLLTENRRGTKMMAEALIDESLTTHDYIYLNNAIKCKNGEDTQETAMIEFVQSIGPYLSDRALFIITDNLIKVEMQTNKKPFNGKPCLALCFLVYELHRQLKQLDNPTCYPGLFINHLITNMGEQCFDEASVDEFMKSNIVSFIGCSDELLVKIEYIRSHQNMFGDIQASYFSLNRLSDEAMLDSVKYLRDLRQVERTATQLL